MALARKSQMLQASFCLFALVASSTILPSVAHSTGRSLLQVDPEETLDNLNLPQDDTIPAESPADEFAESPLSAASIAASPIAESPSAASSIAESPLSGGLRSSIAASSPEASPLESSSATAPAPAAESIDELGDVDVPMESVPTVVDVPIESSANVIASMGALVMAIAISAAMGFVM